MNQDQTPVNTAAKQQVIDALKKANNVLITVNQNPSIDQLASCIGLALMLNKLNKHATAIFSGTVPSTIEFLQPEKTLETNTDSLRDFIISLDRSKADKLRYKVEDNIVRIFITPYRTALSEKDFIYSQGDFNVDAVIALGVDQREHLDTAIMQQGRILHDAVVMGISVGANPSNVGAINWHDPAASSISELMVSIGDAMQAGLLDTQISTALLTGIVSETDRFRNEKTTAKVMTVSAQLMAAGANQQLVAKQLEVNQQPQVQPQANAAPLANMPSPQGAFDVPQEGESGPKEAAVSLHIDPNAPAPAVQLPGEEQDEEIKRIKIDEEGMIHDEPQAGAVENQILDKPHKVIQPLSGPAEGSASNGYIFTPPTMGGTLTAETQDNPMLEAPNPTVQSPSATPMLSHEPSIPEATPSPTVSQPPSIPSASQPVEPHELPTPEIHPAVDPVAPPVTTQDAPSEEQLNQEAARKAVLEAVAATPSAAPTPIAALNAMPMDLSAPAQTQPAQNPLAPPPLPPPITPLVEMPTPMPEPTPGPVPREGLNLPQPTTPQVGNTPFNLPPPPQQ